MGSAMSTYRGAAQAASSWLRPTAQAASSWLRPRALPLLALQVLLQYGRPDLDSAGPPATAALLAANVLIFLRPGALDAILPTIGNVALNPNIFFKFRYWDKFFLSPLYHVDEVHLFCNMTGLLWTGVELETSMGTARFASMVAALLGLSQCATLLLSKGLCLLGDGYDAMYYDGYCVGFSGVLFGMASVMMSGGPAKYAVWADLFLSALIPESSFVGHLGGILAGYAYLWLKSSFSRPRPCPFNRPGGSGSLNRPGPGSINKSLGDPGSFNKPGLLSGLISCGTRAMAFQVRFAQKLVRSCVLLLPKGHVTGQCRVGCCASASRGSLKGYWVCSSCSDYNSLATDICERCSTMREDCCAFSWGQHHVASCNGELTVEELRLRRVHRFDM